jgi:hypothetical protein
MRVRFAILKLLLFEAGRHWLMPLILARDQRDIRRIAVQSQPYLGGGGGRGNGWTQKRHSITHKKRAGRVAQAVRVPA